MRDVAPAKDGQVKPSFSPNKNASNPGPDTSYFQDRRTTMHTRTSKHNNSSGVRLNPQPKVPRPAHRFPAVGRPEQKVPPPRTQNSPDAALAALAFSFFFLAALALVLRPIVIGDAVRSSGRVARGYRRTLFTACLSELVHWPFIYEYASCMANERGMSF